MSTNYWLARAKKETAMEAYNYAGSRLDLAKIHERLAEASFQSEPASSIVSDTTIGVREKMMKLAYWVVIGRLPQPGEIE